MGTRIGLLKIPVLDLVLCLVVDTCFAFYCISAVLRDRCWFCCSVLTATVINEHYIIIIIIIIIIVVVVVVVVNAVYSIACELFANQFVVSCTASA